MKCLRQNMSNYIYMFDFYVRYFNDIMDDLKIFYVTLYTFAIKRIKAYNQCIHILVDPTKFTMRDKCKSLCLQPQHHPQLRLCHW